MNKKDFIALADCIRAVNDDVTIPCELFTPRQIGALASFCYKRNTKFNHERWMDYIAGKCGPNGGQKGKS